ncbi:aquaporin Z [Salinisphaera sp. SPP-AMP-43]|uniref:aquaporin Z n=1 Tax=Salinisphaera sp. SPP-AMP-43 TaxID=3121288 RepID=UPI003C6E3A34
MVPLSKRLFAELFGTFWLVFGGCGSAVVAAAFPNVGIGLLGVSLAFGLTLLTMAYSIGHISGCHLNPAVTIGLWAGKRFPARDIAPYIGVQVVGAVLACVVLLLVASGRPEFVLSTDGLAANGYGRLSPGGYNLVSGVIAELILTFGFVMVILGATDTRSPSGFAPLAIGLALTLVHLISIPITNTSVNPARSTGPALLMGGLALSQLWLFWLAPALGALAAGVSYRVLAGTPPAPAVTGEALP